MPHVITRARRWQVVAGLILLATLVAGCGEATDGAGRSAAKDDSLPVTERLARYHDAWDRAADRTPHGTPIELRPEDFAS